TTSITGNNWSVTTGGTGTFNGTVTAKNGGAGQITIGTDATHEITANDGTINTASALNVANTVTNSGNATMGTGAGLTNTFGSGGTATNTFGSNATTNSFGVGATTNTMGTAGTSTNAINGTTTINDANASNNNTSINTTSGSG